MTPTTWRTRLTRTAALGALTFALTSSLAAAPASAGPTNDFLTAIDTGSAGLSTPGPTTPPTGAPQSYTFTITTSPEYSRLNMIANFCAEVTRTLNGQPINDYTDIPPSSVTQWTIAHDSDPDSGCTFTTPSINIAYTRLGAAVNKRANLDVGIKWTGVGYVKCVTGACTVGPNGLLVGW
ncbi:hypothetical protein [Rhodococcus sp. P1Y]|uniref:hypothetical protein n=1 Tax=Rhodococcus sp. P1Y TaxID=1302308 RepID=UPI000EAB9159|nr:hypothetical protein [Rhodococcus sp. P1Y]AYJ48855.1 hypothetical protein D8W71_11480 [Rhodococcus sp. P1Y]